MTPRLFALALSFCLASTAAAPAADYWTCVDGQWTAVGQPAYPKPVKVCGAHLTLPRSKEACEQAGGAWQRGGISPRPICTLPTRDGGRVCGDTDECEGLCLATLTATQRDQLREHQTVTTLGQCARRAPLFGCMAPVKQGAVMGVLCRD